MSNMLEQAIIDADALREAAVKNAESLVLEKFSDQIKYAVTALLEQDDPLAPGAAPAPPGEPLAEDPGLGAMSGGGLDMGFDEEMMEEEESSVMEHLPIAATQKDVNEKVSIPLDKLMEEIEKVNKQMEEQTEIELVETDLYNLLETDDQLEEDDDQLEEDDETLEETIYDEIAESLTVEMSTNRTGWSGMPRSLIELSEEELLALEQDSEVREQKTAMRAAVRELENVKESLENKNKKLADSLKEAKRIIYKLRDTAMLLKEKLDSVNLSNAKLIYTNKALTSDSLNERQKNKLAEAISNADNIEEAKVIFETLQSTVGSTSHKSQPKSLGEVIQRPSSMILSSRTNRTERQKVNPVYNRWRSLAGIEKDKN